MRARLFVISNFTTSQLLTILQNWITNTSEITVDGQMLTVTSVYFLSNDTNPVLTSTSPNKTSNTENNIKNIAILFSAIGAAGGLSLFLNCVCCIIISVCVFMFKSQKNENFKPRFVVYITSTNNDIITINTENKESKKTLMKIKISAILQEQQNLVINCTIHAITMVFLQIGNQRLFVTNYVLFYILLSLVLQILKTIMST